MSLIWPAVCHGSLVISTSPDASFSGGNAAKKCFIDVAMALMWPGVPLNDCAIIRPRVSKRPHARSWLSRTIVLKAVRIRASCCSLATDMKRLQMTSNVTGSMTLFFMIELHNNIQPLVDPGSCASADDQRGFTFFDNRRPGEFRPRIQRIAVIDGCLDVLAAFGKVSSPPTSPRLPFCSCIRRQL